MVDDGHAVAQCVRLLHIVGGQHNRDALFAQASYCVPHGNPALRIQPCAGLVQKQYLGAMRDCPGYLHPLRQTARQLGRIRARTLLQVELPQQLLRALPGLRMGKTEI